MSEPGEVRACRYLDQLIAIQVNELDTLRAELGIKPALDQYEVRIPLMTWSLTNNDTLRPEPQERLGHSANEKGIRIHLNARDVFDEIGFQQDRFFWGDRVQIIGSLP